MNLELAWIAGKCFVACTKTKRTIIVKHTLKERFTDAVQNSSVNPCDVTAVLAKVVAKGTWCFLTIAFTARVI